MGDTKVETPNLDRLARERRENGAGEPAHPKLPTVAKCFDQSFTAFDGLGPRVLVSDDERALAEASDKLGQGPRFWEIKTNLQCSGKWLPAERQARS